MHQLPIVFPNDFVKKSNDFIRSKLTIKDTLAGRMLAIAASVIQTGDVDFYAYKISTDAFFINDRNKGGSQYEQIKKATDDLAQANMFKKTGKNSFVRYPIFYKIAYESGFIEITFHPEAKPFFLDLKEHFTKYNLIEFLMLRSVYSQRLFEVLKSWESISEVCIQLHDLQNTLNATDSLRKNFAHFSRRVLEPAHKEIHEKTSLDYDWETIKTKNKVTAIKFIFYKKNQNSNKKIKMLTDKFIAEQARPGETWEEARSRLSNRNNKLTK
jgi:plasmid replication initiation protein